MARHPDLRMRMTSALSHARCDVSYENLKYWFDELKDYLAQVTHADLLEDLSRLYNVMKQDFRLRQRPRK